ncbi:MAG: heparinase II/III family protein, partial [Myxococcales bacterium]|nr:heparinase II/III family protein [Myxococcales bacterium]
LGATRVLVDAGVGTYDVGPERSYARSTAAHNTVGVGLGTADQHELWASHRIGARARCETLACAEHRLVGRVRGHDSPAAHRRTIEHHAGTIRITDTLEPPGAPAVVRYFVPEALPLTLHGDTAIIEADGRRCELRALGLAWHRAPALGWLGMGRPAPRVCLSVPVLREGTRVELRPLEG